MSSEDRKTNNYEGAPTLPDHISLITLGYGQTVGGLMHEMYEKPEPLVSQQTGEPMGGEATHFSAVAYRAVIEPGVPGEVYPTDKFDALPEDAPMFILSFTSCAAIDRHIALCQELKGRMWHAGLDK